MNFGKRREVAASEVVSIILIALISIALFTTVYSWALPLIEKRQACALSERVDAYFNPNSVNSLPSQIENVANLGGERTFTYENVDGVTTINPVAGIDTNYIEFQFATKCSLYAEEDDLPPGNKWLSISGGSCSDSEPLPGTLGLDKTSVVCVRSNLDNNNFFNIRYRVWFRELEDSTMSNGFKINLVQHESGPLASKADSVRISFSDRQESNIGGKTLITTDVKILLV